MEEKLDANNAQIASVTKEGFKIYDDSRMNAIVEKLEAEEPAEQI